MHNYTLGTRERHGTCGALERLEVVEIHQHEENEEHDERNIMLQ